MCKYDFETIFFKKIQFAGKSAKTPFFAVLSSDLKRISSMKKKKIDYSSSLPHLIDVNWLIDFIFCVKWLERKSQL